MRKRFRLYRRQSSGRYYLHDQATGRQLRLSATSQPTAQARLRCLTELQPTASPIKEKEL